MSESKAEKPSKHSADSLKAYGMAPEPTADNAAALNAAAVRDEAAQREIDAKYGPKPKPVSIASYLSSMLQAVLVLAAFGMIYLSVIVVPEGAIQEIYQLNLFTSGIILIAVVGVWSAIDAVARKK